MFGEIGSIGKNILIVELSTGGPLSAFWQILAVLAVAGIVIVAILAIIEPGPLVKRRPFPRKERLRGSEEEGRDSGGPQLAPESADRNPGQNDGG